MSNLEIWHNPMHPMEFRLQVAVAEIERLTKERDELLSAVGQKWPNETRHETALRYIRAMESQANAMLPKQEVLK